MHKTCKDGDAIESVLKNKQKCLGDTEVEKSGRERHNLKVGLDLGFCWAEEVESPWDTSFGISDTEQAALLLEVPPSWMTSGPPKLNCLQVIFLASPHAPQSCSC